MSFTEFSLIFMFGLVSSLHCVQMCGPLVIALSLPFSHQSVWQQFFAQLSYHLGRLVTYTLLGAVAGLTGRTIGVFGQITGMQNLVAVVTGILMLLAGLVMLDLIPTRQFQRFDPLRGLSKALRPIGKRVAAPTVKSKFSLGLMLGLMPCGLIYAALLKAMATGTAIAGAMTMTAFALGTISALLGLGVCSSAFSRRLGNWGNRLAALSVTMIGAVLLWRGLIPLFGGAMEQAASGHQCH